MARNIEIKARIASVEAALACALSLADGAPVVIDQDDTFFAVAHDRLKLRRFADGSAGLIQYLRPDRADAKASDYVRVPVADADALGDALTRACGALGRVRKRRLLLMADRAASTSTASTASAISSSSMSCCATARATPTAPRSPSG